LKEKQNFTINDIEHINVAPIGWGQHSQVFVVSVFSKDGSKVQFVLKIAQLAGVTLFKYNIKTLAALNQSAGLAVFVPKLGAVYDKAGSLSWSEEYINAGGMDLREWRNKLTGVSAQVRLRAIEKEAIRTYYLLYKMSGGGYIEDSGPGNVVIREDAQGRLSGKVIDIVQYKKSASQPAILDWLEPFLTVGYDYDPGLIVEVILEEGGQAELLELKNNFPAGDKWAKLLGVLNDLKETGGIDFRSLPTIMQPAAPGMLQGLSLTAVIPSPTLDKEWSQIENMLNGGIIPSVDRLKDYLESSCKSPDCQARINQVLSGIADILRMEEESYSFTEESLKQLLVLLESDKPANELQVALLKIQVLAKEPKLRVAH
jgi:hypothetical protein